MSKFCQHPDCPNSAENPGPCSLCGFPKKNPPKHVEALHLAGLTAVSGFLLSPACAMIPLVLGQIFPSIHKMVVQGLAYLIFILVAGLVPFAVLNWRKKDVDLTARILAPDKFQSEVNKSLTFGIQLAVIGGSLVVIGVSIYLALSNASTLVFPSYILSQVGLSAILPGSISQFIYSRQLRAVRSGSEGR